MDQEINDLLLGELEEAHFNFENIIGLMDHQSVPYSINELIVIENNSYRLSHDAIDKMDDALLKFQELHDNNPDYFDGEARIILKHIMLYAVSIIMIKIFSKTLTSEKLNEMWYAMLGLAFGSVNTSIIYSNLRDYRYANEKNRNIMNELTSLKEEYDKNFEIARREISYMFALNRNLDGYQINEKKLHKIIKDMQ